MVAVERTIPDNTRQWLMPKRKISLRTFQFLLERRSKALFRHSSSTDVVTTSNNSNPDFKKNDFLGVQSQLELLRIVDHEEREIKDVSLKIVGEQEKPRDGDHDMDWARVDDHGEKAVDENVLNSVETRDVCPDGKSKVPLNPNSENAEEELQRRNMEGMAALSLRMSPMLLHF